MAWYSIELTVLNNNDHYFLEEFSKRFEVLEGLIAWPRFEA